jgi:flagellar biosynthesis anti-sigma factor FlgM
LLDMKVNDPNLSSLASTGASSAQQTGRTGQAARTTDASAAGVAAPSDDIHLSELVRSLRSLAADSPERQSRIEQIARAYASGTYQVDAQATASGIINDAFQRS